VNESELSSIRHRAASKKIKCSAPQCMRSVIVFAVSFAIGVYLLLVAVGDDRLVL